MKVVIDRFEGDLAVVELSDMTFADMPKKLLPVCAKEGDVVSIEIEADDTERAKKIIDKKVSKLFVD